MIYKAGVGSRGNSLSFRSLCIYSVMNGNREQDKIFSEGPG